MTKNIILTAVKKASGEKEIHLEFPESEEHGDYSTNIAMQKYGKHKERFEGKYKRALGKATFRGEWPTKYAEETVKKLKEDGELMNIVSKIEIAGPGFINFWLSKEVLLSELTEVVKDGENYGHSSLRKDKKYLLEHTSPNTIKTLHVGHIRNNVLGMAMHNILEFAGAKVSMDAINNDRGIHVMKAVWAYQKYGKGKKPKKGEKTDQFVDQFYTKGVKAEEDKIIKEEMQELLRKWEKGDKEIRETWKELRDWTFEGFKQTYTRLGSKHDEQWFESEIYKEGKEIVKKGLEKGIFKRLPDGAVLSNLKKFGLTDAILLRSDGTSMYHTQDLRLTQLKRKKFPSNLYIWDIGPEQSLYLKQLFAMCEQLGIGKRKDYFHLSYGFVFLKTGKKMSSRRGNIISADWLIREMVKRAKKIIENSETTRGLSEKEKGEVAEAVGIGAIKYGFLKPARETDIHFDMDESLSLEGNSGPYLQYTYTRTQSVLAKSKRVKEQESRNKLALNKEELAVLRALPRFTEVVEQSAERYAPNLLCNYLFGLAQKYNAFYARHRILDTNNERTKSKALSDGEHRILDQVNSDKKQNTEHHSPNTSEFRLALTAAVGQILINGLTILGIQAPERM